MTYWWNHSLGEVITALTQAGLVVEFVHEFDYAGFGMFPFMERGDDGYWRLPEHAESVPLMFSIRARRPQ